MDGDRISRITMELDSRYKFLIDFNVAGAPILAVDEPPPLGEGRGPNAARLLAAAVGNCMSASALYCLRKARIDVKSMRTTVEFETRRNERGRVRVREIDVRIEPEVSDEDRPRMQRCLEIFDDYCVVTQSVRAGIKVNAEVDPKILAPAGSREV